MDPVNDPRFTKSPNASSQSMNAQFFRACHGMVVERWSFPFGEAYIVRDYSSSSRRAWYPNHEKTPTLFHSEKVSIFTPFDLKGVSELLPRILDNNTPKKANHQPNHVYIYVYIGSTPHPATVTTMIVSFVVGNLYKPLFAAVTGG